MYDNVKKGLEEAISDVKGEIKLERHMVENNAPKISKKVDNNTKK
ncbi:MAG: hypothetical protein K0R05_3839 [Anaerocolumna sp.]|nr:hypothetical protein [Anaerocolumna sp.]